MIKGVIFDKDGTLFDFRKAWGPWVRRVLTTLAPDAKAADQMGHLIGYDLQTSTFAPDSPVIAATVQDSAALMLPFLPDWTLERLVAQLDLWAMEVALVETVPLRPLLTSLRNQGIKIGLATNDTEAPARRHLESAGILDLFDFIAGYDSGHGGKPEPGMLVAFLRQTGLTGGQVAMVGDSLHDLESGRAAGMRRVAVLTGVAKTAELAPHADIVLADIGGLSTWIATQAQ